MSKSYFLLLAKKTIVSLMKFLFPKSKLTNQAYDSVHLALATQKEMKKFKDLSIKNYKDLFFHFSPIPNEDEIKNFYANLYAHSRQNSKFYIGERELSQMIFLKKNFNFLNKKNFKFWIWKKWFFIPVQLTRRNSY